MPQAARHLRPSTGQHATLSLQPMSVKTERKSSAEVDNQPAQFILVARRMVGAAIAIALVVLIGTAIAYLLRPGPYVREVLSLSSNPERGQAIYQINCAGCHGRHADGNVGPSLHALHQRKSKAAIIRQVTGGNTPPMPKFHPNPQDMSDLLGYLEQL